MLEVQIGQTRRETNVDPLIPFLLAYQLGSHVGVRDTIKEKRGQGSLNFLSLRGVNIGKKNILSQLMKAKENLTSLYFGSQEGFPFELL